MGMKYPAGMGMVEARISIQNCGSGSPGQRLEAPEQGMDKRRQDRGQGSVLERKRVPGHAPTARVWH